MSQAQAQAPQAPQAPQARKPKPKPRAMKIGTHDGTFHCDEALACFMLRLLPRFKDADIVRSRDPAVLAACDVVVDVGGVYDPDKLRFDHHQRGFQHTLSDKHDIKLSSAGLVYKHFGRDILNQLLGDIARTNLDRLFHKVYAQFIEPIDGIDNGVQQYDTDKPPRYRVSTDVSSRVGMLNPRWNDPDQSTDSRFFKAMQLVGEEFCECVDYFGKAWLPARDIVEAVVNKRHDVDSSGKIIELSQFAPWKEHLHEIEGELDVSPPIEYCIFSDQRGSWRVQAVSVAPGSFQSRKALPESWRGLRDDALSKECGVDGCVFAHANGFIGGNKTREGALEMARKAALLAGPPVGIRIASAERVGGKIAGRVELDNDAPMLGGFELRVGDQDPVRFEAGNQRFRVDDPCPLDEVVVTALALEASESSESATITLHPPRAVDIELLLHETVPPPDQALARARVSPVLASPLSRDQLVATLAASVGDELVGLELDSWHAQETDGGVVPNAGIVVGGGAGVELCTRVRLRGQVHPVVPAIEAVLDAAPPKLAAGCAALAQALSNPGHKSVVRASVEAVRDPLQAHSLVLMSANLRVDWEEMRRVQPNTAPSISDSQNAWSARLPLVAALIRERGPAVVGTQEGLAGQLASLCERLGFERFGKGRDGDGGGEHTDLVYDPKKVRLLDGETLWLSESPTTPGSVSWGASFPRMQTWGLFCATDASSIEFCVINVHFDHHSKPARQESASLVLALAKDLHARFDGVPVFVTGDFNTNKSFEDTWAKATKEFLQDVWLTTSNPDEGLGLGGSFHGFAGVNGSKVDEAVRSGGNGHIDWVLWGHDTRVCRVVPTGAALVTSGNQGDVWPSDHFPLCAAFDIQPGVSRSGREGRAVGNLCLEWHGKAREVHLVCGLDNWGVRWNLKPKSAEPNRWALCRYFPALEPVEFKFAAPSNTRLVLALLVLLLVAVPFAARFLFN